MKPRHIFLAFCAGALALDVVIWAQGLPMILDRPVYGVVIATVRWLIVLFALWAYSLAAEIVRAKARPRVRLRSGHPLAVHEIGYDSDGLFSWMLAAPVPIIAPDLEVRSMRPFQALYFVTVEDTSATVVRLHTGAEGVRHG